MIRPADIQFAMESSERKIKLSPLAVDLTANLLNAFIYEYRDHDAGAILRRHHLALEFVFKDLAAVVAQASAELRVEPSLNAVDLLHWVSPRWPDILKRSPLLGFIFDKE